MDTKKKNVETSNKLNISLNVIFQAIYTTKFEFRSKYDIKEIMFYNALKITNLIFYLWLALRYLIYKSSNYTKNNNFFSDCLQKKIISTVTSRIFTHS